MRITADKAKFTLRHPLIALSVAGAKYRSRQVHPECAVCGKVDPLGQPCESHHVIPQHIAPHLAADPGNLRTLCRLHHWLIGHMGQSWKRYNARLDPTIYEIRRAYQSTARINEYCEPRREP